MPTRPQDTPDKPAPRKRAAAAKPDPRQPDPRPITEPQMRHLHGLLHSRLGLRERDDVLDYLSVALGRDVETRKALSYSDAEAVIGLLEPLPLFAVDATDPRWALLRAPFPPEEVGKLPRSTCKACSDSPRKRCDQHSWVTNCPACRNSHSSATMHIDFVGHADVTARLLAVDPMWTWRPFTEAELQGIPPSMRNGLWIMLRVLGHEVPGFGHAEGDRQKGGDAVKVAIGDALRNAAMRFGVALDLWAKGDRDWAAAPKEWHEPAPDEPQPQQPEPQWDGPSTAESLLRIDAAAASIGLTYEQITAKFRERHGLTMDALDSLPPAVAHDLADQIEKHATETFK